jgi:hypothetical protein
MKTECEQLWYTWSNKGFGATGFQIRAISPGFLQDQGEHNLTITNPTIDLNAERIQTLLPYVRYTLPTGTDLSEVTPEQAPISLAFLRSNNETFLLHKAYIGNDGTNKTSIHFTHVLTALPQQTLAVAGSAALSSSPALSSLHPSQSGAPGGPEQQTEFLPFTAREAINLWDSPSWKTQDTLAPDEKLLPRVTFSFAQPQTIITTTPSGQDEAALPVPLATQFFKQGTLGRHTLKILNRAHLEFLIQAFLMHRPGQHIYLAGDSATIARLLWGLTNSLPRTLTLFDDLTFSTYEPLEEFSASGVYHSISDQARPTIIGTCWQQAQEHELPLSYYHADGINGFALNCYNDRKTALTPNKFTTRFASYAVDCLLEENNHTIAELREILTQAEQEHCQDLYHFVRIFNAFQAVLEPEDVLYLLRAINENLDNIAEHTTMLLTDIARLRRPNVLKSIVSRIAENRYWWESSCLPELNSFYAFMVKYTSLPMPVDIEAVLENLQSAVNELCEQIAIQINRAIRNNQEESMYFWNDMLEKSAPLQQTEPVWLTLLSAIEMEDLDQPAYLLWWKICGKHVIAELHAAAQGTTIIHEPDMPLNHLGSIIANKIQVALQHNDVWALGAWSETFAQVAAPDQEAVAWIYLLQTLVTSPYTPLYWEWWNTYGKQGVTALSEALETDEQHLLLRLPELCNGIISNTVMLVRRANPATGIQGTGRQEWLFWHDVLSVLLPLHADYEQAHAVWLNLWGSLWPYIFNPAFAQWWHPRGQRVAQAICTFVERHPQSERANDLIAFILESIVPLAQQQIVHMLEQNRSDPEQGAAWENYQHQLFLLLEILAVSTPRQVQSFVWDAPEEQPHSTDQDTAEIAQDQLLKAPTFSTNPTNDAIQEEKDDAASSTMETKEKTAETAESEQFTTDESAIKPGDLMHSLARTLQDQPADQVYDWEEIRFLLETWSMQPTLHTSSQLAPWLTISWQGIGNLLATSYLPSEWQVQAIIMVLATPITLQPHQVIALVVEHQALFATAITRLLEQSESEQEALDFFQYLLDFGYPQKPELLSLLLLSSLERPEHINKLLEHADLTQEEIVSLLENHCAEIIEHTPWPKEIDELIQCYLYELDVAMLKRPVTRAFIHGLARNEPYQSDLLPVSLRNAIIGWDSIRSFMEPGTDTALWLQGEAAQSKYLAAVPLSKRAQLQEKLTSELVKVLRHETGIIAALHSLSPLYDITDEQDIAQQEPSATPAPALAPRSDDKAATEHTEPSDTQLSVSDKRTAVPEESHFAEDEAEHNAPFAPELRLLHDLSEQASTIFADEHPPIHLLPYLKLILIYAQELVGESKERYLDSCLYPLLLHVSESEQAHIDTHTTLWLPELRQDWQHYRQRQPQVHEQAVLNYFRKTLRTGNVETITRAYQRVLRDVRYPATRIDAQERECAQLARDIVIAYNSREPEMLQQAYQNIQNSPYKETIRYTPALQQALGLTSGVTYLAQPQLAQGTPPPPSSAAAAERIPVSRLPFSSSPIHPSSPSYHSSPTLSASADIAEMKTIDQSELRNNDENDNVEQRQEMQTVNEETNDDSEAQEPLAEDDNLDSGSNNSDVDKQEETADGQDRAEPSEQPAIQLRRRLTRPFMPPSSAHNIAYNIQRQEQSEQDESDEQHIGAVLDEPITLAQLERVYALKRLYLDFRIHHLELRMKHLPPPEKKFYSYEIKVLTEQQGFADEALRTCALDDLIDDCFIRQYIDEQVELDSKLSPTYFALHPQITAKFIAYDPSTYRTICNTHQLIGQDTTEVLSLFRRRELLAHYLFLKQQKTTFDQLDRWLAEERHQQHQQIKIDTERAGLQSDKKAAQARKGRSSFLGAFLRH